MSRANRLVGSYGDLIMTTPLGRWYWSRGLQDINYVPKFRQMASDRVILRRQENDFYGALRAASRANIKIVDSEEKGT